MILSPFNICADNFYTLDEMRVLGLAFISDPKDARFVRVHNVSVCPAHCLLKIRIRK